MSPSKVTSRKKGFTLIEVLIALLIVATALGTASKIILDAVTNNHSLKDKAAAQWVGLNQLSTLKLRRQWPVRTESGEEEMMQRTWIWEQTAESTADDNLIRVSIAVRLEGADEDELKALVTGFVAKLN